LIQNVKLVTTILEDLQRKMHGNACEEDLRGSSTK
jgi:hypothetical protein